MKRSDAFPSKYISKDNVKIPVVATIAGVRHETLKGDNGDEQKTVMYFDGEIKPLIINNTNWMTAEDLWGDESDNWIGKQIELYFEPNVMYGGKRTGGVRIRKPTGTLTPTNPPFENFAAALEYVQSHGGQADEFKSFLQEHGLTKFSGQRDSGLVYEFVADVSAEAIEF